MSRIAPKVGQNNRREDFRQLRTSRECEEQREYWSHITQSYVLLGWAKDGEPIFCDNGIGADVWDPYKATENRFGRRVCDVLYWRCWESSGGCGRMLPSDVRINPKNMWLEFPNNDYCGC